MPDIDQFDHIINEIEKLVVKEHKYIKKEAVLDIITQIKHKQYVSSLERALKIAINDLKEIDISLTDKDKVNETITFAENVLNNYKKNEH